MEKSVRQRRDGAINDCFQMKMDIDHFNEAYPNQVPLPLFLDFTDDVAEMEARIRAGKDVEGDAA